MVSFILFSSGIDPLDMFEALKRIESELSDYSEKINGQGNSDEQDLA